MTVFADQLYHHGGIPVGGLFSTHTSSYFVAPGSGADTNVGTRVDKPWALLSKAKTSMTADKNAVVYLVSEDNSASGTTNRIVSSTFDWDVDGSVIQGVASGSLFGSRARISNTANAANVSPLMTWSASNSSMRNVHVFYGEADAGDLGCFEVTGERNYFYRCHFAGIGDNAQDVTGAYSLRVTGDENTFEDCVIGLDTIARGTNANSEILFASQATRNVFKNCKIITYAEDAGHQFIIAGASSLDRFVLFENCTFINAVDSGATTMTEAFDVNAARGGSIILQNCVLVGATDWDASDSG